MDRTRPPSCARCVVLRLGDPGRHRWRQGVRAAIREVFGNRPVVQRCQVHKMRNVAEHLPQHAADQAKRLMRNAYRSGDADVRDEAAQAPGEPPAQEPPECRTVRGGGSGRDPHNDADGTASRAAAHALHDEPDREPDVADPPLPLARPPVEGRFDDRALDGNGRDRGREGIPSPQGSRRDAQARCCSPSTRREEASPCFGEGGRVEVMPSAAQIQQDSGHRQATSRRRDPTKTRKRSAQRGAASRRLAGDFTSPLPN
ncbi:MAG: transposase [Deltaproteobacteria bacterium]|nr:transposase [Deltaproteobacteria bacterium]